MNVDARQRASYSDSSPSVSFDSTRTPSYELCTSRTSVNTPAKTANDGFDEGIHHVQQRGTESQPLLIELKTMQNMSN